MYWTEARSPAFTFLPLPLTMSFLTSAVGGVPDGAGIAGSFLRSLEMPPGTKVAAGAAVSSAAAFFLSSPAATGDEQGDGGDDGEERTGHRRG